VRVYTVRNHLELAERALKNGPHADKARLDSEQLLMHLLGRNRAWLIAHPRKELSAENQDRYESLIRRRLAGEPVQYITGECEFYGLPLKVTPDVLIPRPETEHLVERAGQLIPTFTLSPKGFLEIHKVIPADHRDKSRRAANPHEAGWPPRVLDVGTGSGAIAISIAHDWSEAEITAIDISAPALEVARSNAGRLGYLNQVRFLEGDLLAPVAGERFEIIVSNPPYVPDSDRASLAVEVREYEPPLALFAGEDGLDVYRRLIPAALPALVPGGFLALEIGFSQAEQVQNLLTEAGFANIESTPDLQGIPRVISAQRP
jgi:release factor glutamine methyltransferase